MRFTRDGIESEPSVCVGKPFPIHFLLFPLTHLLSVVWIVIQRPRSASHSRSFGWGFQFMSPLIKHTHRKRGLWFRCGCALCSREPFCGNHFLCQKTPFMSFDRRKKSLAPLHHFRKTRKVLLVSPSFFSFRSSPNELGLAEFQFESLRNRRFTT